MKSSGVLKEILITEASKTIKYRDCRIVIHKEKGGGYTAHIFDDLGKGFDSINKSYAINAKTQKRARDMAEIHIDGQIRMGYIKERD